MNYLSSTDGSDILLNVFLAIAVDNLADADALGENEAKDEDAVEVDAEGVVYEVRATLLGFKISNCNCNWGTCIAPPTGGPRVHHRVNPYLGARRQNETEMFSDHDETSPSIAAVSAPSVACSMLAVQQQKRLCRRFCRNNWNDLHLRNTKHTFVKFWEKLRKIRSQRRRIWNWRLT